MEAFIIVLVCCAVIVGGMWMYASNRVRDADEAWEALGQATLLRAELSKNPVFPALRQSVEAAFAAALSGDEKALSDVRKDILKTQSSLSYPHFAQSRVEPGDTYSQTKMSAAVQASQLEYYLFAYMQRAWFRRNPRMIAMFAARREIEEYRRARNDYGVNEPKAMAPFPGQRALTHNREPELG